MHMKIYLMLCILLLGMKTESIDIMCNTTVVVM